ncbi:MAG: nucleoside monophosphate kinase [Minisyncoccia bacterium]
MSPKTIILFGPSGSGKGTQANLLIEKLKAKDDREVLYLETGQRFREFSKEASFAAKKTKEIMQNGGLLPEFLPIWIWTEYMIRHVSGEEHMILDGLSRRAHEAPILDSAMKFYGREKPIVISIEVSRDWSRERLLGRKRGDDNEKDIERRIDWYYQNVLPAIEFFEKNESYEFHSINGEQTIEAVHADIVRAINL